jgi:hypothetical protein
MLAKLIRWLGDVDGGTVDLNEELVRYNRARGQYETVVEDNGDRPARGHFAGVMLNPDSAKYRTRDWLR